MNIVTLQEKIQERAKKRADEEYKLFVEFMLRSQFVQLLTFKKGDRNVPFCGHYGDSPLFETGIKNEMKDADNYTNFNEARRILFEKFVEIETNELLNKFDSLSDYFQQ